MHPGAHRFWKFILDQMYFTVSPPWHIYLLYGKCLYSTCACSPQNVQVAKYVYTLISYKYYDLAIGLKPNAGIRDYLLRILVLGYWVLVMITRSQCTWFICHHGVSQKQVWSFIGEISCQKYKHYYFKNVFASLYYMKNCELL